VGGERAWLAPAQSHGGCYQVEEERNSAKKKGKKKLRITCALLQPMFYKRTMRFWGPGVLRAITGTMYKLLAEGKWTGGGEKRGSGFIYAARGIAFGRVHSEEV